MELEDKQFEDYANRVIDYLGKHGRNTYPMKKVRNYYELRINIKKKFILIKKVLDDHLKQIRALDLEDTSEAANIKKHQNDVPTAKNLGFIPLGKLSNNK